MNLLEVLRGRFYQALLGWAPDPLTAAALVKPATDAKFGDYQANAAMSLGKSMGKPPRQVAEELLARLQWDDILEKPEIAGPGFINLKFRNDYLEGLLSQAANDDRIGIAKVANPRRIVIDFSGPNVAKPMHVGHLRSTILGESLARLHRFLGHLVITDNHLGDWGTQFGILLYGYRNKLDAENLKKNPVAELARLYVEVRKEFKTGSDEEGGDKSDPVQDACRLETVKLHQGDEENLALWNRFMPFCLEEIDAVYRRLDVHFDHILGESHYQPMLATVVEDLLSLGIARESQGAVGVFLTEEGAPALIRKSDGAFTYTTTDLATIDYRIREFNPTDILYVVDSRQHLHFHNLFETAKRWGRTGTEKGPRLVHVPFGSVLGTDRKPIKTRDGKAVANLDQLLDEAVRLAGEIFDANRAEDAELFNRSLVAETVGIGAVKYADLSQNRTTDYVFSWEKMLAMDGNTAAYMQYAYARCQSILRKAGVSPEALDTKAPISLATPEERALAIQILRMEEILLAGASELRPNIITGYLWDLAKAYSGFFQNCPVIKAPPALLPSRLLLCHLVARSLKLGLELLGIQVIERM